LGNRDTPSPVFAYQGETKELAERDSRQRIPEL
jgi:hypothetical protein